VDWWQKVGSQAYDCAVAGLRYPYSGSVIIILLLIC